MPVTHTRPLDLVIAGQPHMRNRLNAMLKKVAPHLTLESVGGDAQAIYGLVAMTRGEKPKVGPLCSICFSFP